MPLPQEAISRIAVKRLFLIGISIVFLCSMTVCAECALKDFLWKIGGTDHSNSELPLRGAASLISTHISPRFVLKPEIRRDEE